MSLESDARARLEAQRRLAQQQEAQRTANLAARENENQRLRSQWEQALADAIGNFRALKPKEILEEVKHAWRTGRIVNCPDTLYEEVEPAQHWDGVMLYQKGSSSHTHSRDSKKGYYEQPGGWGENNRPSDGIGNGRGPWIPAYSVDIDTSTAPVDVARIYLVHGQGGFQILAEDRSGSYTTTKTKKVTETGWFSSETEESSRSGYYVPLLSNSPGRFDIRSARFEDIRNFFVETTSWRMGGAGNIKISDSSSFFRW